MKNLIKLGITPRELKKYELTKETTTYKGVTVSRIKALKAFGNVKKGDLGGFVQSEANLSHQGNCWVAGNAIVLGTLTLTKDAVLTDEYEKPVTTWYDVFKAFTTKLSGSNKRREMMRLITNECFQNEADQEKTKVVTLRRKTNRNNDLENHKRRLSMNELRKQLGKLTENRNKTNSKNTEIELKLIPGGKKDSRRKDSVFLSP